MGLTARDIMSADPVTAARDLPVTDAARLMSENRIGCLPIVEGDALVGIVTEADLIMQDVKVHFPTPIQILDGLLFYPPAQQRFERELRKAVAARIEDVMTSPPVTVDEAMSVEDVATLMVDREVSHVPVTSGGRLAGIVSKSDIVRSLAGGT